LTQDDEPVPVRQGGVLQIPNDIFAKLVREVASTKGPTTRIALLSIPDQNTVESIGLFKHFGWTTIYECRDDWEEFALAGVGKWYHPIYERYLCAQAHSVVCVSPQLEQKMMLFGAKAASTVVIPNATSRTFVAAAKPYRDARRERVIAGHEPIIGYFGHLTGAWFDWELVVASARRNPGWFFELVGFGGPAELTLPFNVKLIEAVPPPMLPEVTAHWSIAMIPFRPSALASGADPLKIYDYLALGLPTVAVHMSRVAAYPLVRTYRDAAEFDANVRELLEMPIGEEDLAAVDEFLERSTWHDRAVRLLSLAGGMAAASSRSGDQP
jgi:hypothetical protein